MTEAGNRWFARSKTRRFDHLKIMRRGNRRNTVWYPHPCAGSDTSFFERAAIVPKAVLGTTKVVKSSWVKSQRSCKKSTNLFNIWDAIWATFLRMMLFNASGACLATKCLHHGQYGYLALPSKLSCSPVSFLLFLGMAFSSSLAVSRVISKTLRQLQVSQHTIFSHRAARSHHFNRCTTHFCRPTSLNRRIPSNPIPGPIGERVRLHGNEQCHQSCRGPSRRRPLGTRRSLAFVRITAWVSGDSHGSMYELCNEEGPRVSTRVHPAINGNMYPGE